MAYSDPDRYLIRLHRSSYHQLSSLYNPIPSGQTRTGVGGTIYNLTPGLALTALDDRHVQIGTTTLQAEVSALPSAPYAALISASPEFRQYPALDELLALLHAGDMGPFRRALGDTVRSGRVLDATPRLITVASGFQAAWLPAQTHLVRTPKGHWFISLAFRLWAALPAPFSRTRTTFGLDLGTHPVVCAAGGDGRVLGFGGQPIPLLDELRAEGESLSPDERAVLRTLTYAVGRDGAEAAILYLAQHAQTVYAERLRIEGMYSGFVARGRVQATLDLHFSWLRQGLCRAGVPLERVNPAYTSRLCHRHPDTIGRLDGKTFWCPQCNAARHRDVNAAINVHDRGLARYGVLPLRRVS